MTKLIIIDRDGVINEDSDAYIKCPAEWHPIKGSLEAIASLNRADYRVAIATNQSGVGRELFTLQTLNTIHDTMREALARHGGHIDYIAVCPHHPAAGCRCRKPGTGLLREIGDHFRTPLDHVWFIGDSLADREAALAAGCEPVLVLTGKGRTTLLSLTDRPCLVFGNLQEASVHLLSRLAGSEVE